jgi:transposase
MRYELTDFEWVAIRPFLPNKPRGIPVLTAGASHQSEFGCALMSPRPSCSFIVDCGRSTCRRVANAQACARRALGTLLPRA